MKKDYETKQKCPQGSFDYSIKAGDTLFLLAQKFNTTVEDIMELNPKLKPNNLQVGQVICIPRMSPPKPDCSNGFHYTIRQGDTLYELSRRFNVSVEAIIRANPGIDPYNLQIGEVICIPRMSPPIPDCPNGFHYTIRQGDTLYELSRRFNVSVEAIIRANPGIDPYNLQIGQVICIPRMSPPIPDCPNGFHYTIRQGDTIYELSRRFNVSVQAIMRANPGIDPYNLQIGEVICIPRSSQIPCPGGEVYRIASGDNIGSIALKFGVSVMDLMAGNMDIDWEMLRPGQQICILPHKNRGCPCPPGTKSYVIAKSDINPSLSLVVSIAEKFVVSVTDLMLSNPNLAPVDFVVGMRICIPPSTNI